MSGKTVRVGVGQIFSLDGDRSGNFSRIENAIAEAKASGAEIVCFPETVILGWVNPEAHERAFPIPGEDTDRLCELARKYQVFLCVGLAEKDGDKLHDSVILIDEGGKILLTHRKINILTFLMNPPYTPGNDVKAVQTPLGKIGLLICADTFREDVVDKMAALEPDLVLVPYGWAAEEEKWPGHGKELEKVVVGAARRIGAPVVGTDMVGEISKGPWTGQVYGGQSVVADGTGQVLVRGKDRDRDILIVEIPVGH